MHRKPLTIDGNEPIISDRFGRIRTKLRADLKGPHNREKRRRLDAS